MNKATVTELLRDASGGVVGVAYTKDGARHTAHGPVVVATGGFAADFSPDGILASVRPDLLQLPTTNGEHCTGDGIKMSMALGAGTVDMASVQVHPTGLVHPDEPDAKVKFLAAEALRGVGGIMLDAKGSRFVDELEKRDFVSDQMTKNQGPFRLVLNAAASKEILWHCKHYVGARREGVGRARRTRREGRSAEACPPLRSCCGHRPLAPSPPGRGVMKAYPNAAALAAEMGVSPNALAHTFAQYSADAKAGKDRFGKKFFQNAPFTTGEELHVAVITPIVHCARAKAAGAGRVLTGGAPQTAWAASPSRPKPRCWPRPASPSEGCTRRARWLAASTAATGWAATGERRKRRLRKRPCLTVPPPQ